MKRLSNIRNFCIIAHIDHGKSTLADRMLQLTDSVSKRNFRDQLLDSMDLERERGITIKSHPVTMEYKAKDGQVYTFNLIDTPGHVDFTYEVSRSMAACDGALLIVDAAQGVEAQTVANAYMAIENDLEIIPVINKIDLPGSRLEDVCSQLEDILALSGDDAFKISAKTGVGVPELMEAIVEQVPPPKTDDESTRALIFDSFYDTYRGVIAYLRVVDGHIRRDMKLRMMGTNTESDVKEVGIFRPEPTPVKELRAGDVGYVVATIKDPLQMRIGDTITTTKKPATEPLSGFRVVQPMVFSGLYPVTTEDYEKLKLGMDKLSLNDSAFTYQSESSVALGFGFRCGFLGLLHMEVVQERLRREFDLSVINTYPSVVYRVQLKDGSTLDIDNPAHMPDPTEIMQIEEPMIKASIICPNEHISDVMKLVMNRRGSVDKTDSLDTRRVMFTCAMPLNEILVDFHDQLKSMTKGYASMDYDHAGYLAAHLVKLDVMLNGEVVDAFSSIVHSTRAQARGRHMCKALKEVVPRHMFHIAIQASIGGKIIARETVRGMRKDVTAKCYGGDITRKRKLLEKQREGKKRMKSIGKVNVPQEAFISVLKSGA